VRRHLSAQRIASAGLSSCGCCSFACRFMGDSTTKKRCRDLRDSFHELNNRQGLGVSPPRPLLWPCSASELLSIDSDVERASLLHLYFSVRSHLTLSVALFLCAIPDAVFGV
jgi:hypothetical protein